MINAVTIAGKVNPFAAEIANATIRNIGHNNSTGIAGKIGHILFANLLVSFIFFILNYIILHFVFFVNKKEKF
jgi:hypothetical protein